MTFRITVLGGGVVGLSTAVQCVQQWPDATVTLVADTLGDDTTSAGAGGIFRPTFSKVPGVKPDRIMRWLRDSWSHFDRLVHSEDAPNSGLQIISGYQFYNNIKENPLERDVVYHYRALTPAELTMFPGTERASHGFFVTTMMAEGKFYTRFLHKTFLKLGGKIRKQHVTDLKELANESDIVFNCTGLGSRDLLNDKKLVPIRGQLIKVKAPWLKHSILYGDKQCCFIYPGKDDVTVGSTRQEGDDDLNVRAEDTTTIWEQACTLVPSLKGAVRVSEWVGLRPHRDPLRLEAELIPHGKHTLKVVHNYGHGAEGISLSWGTAKEAVSIAQRLLGVDVTSAVHPRSHQRKSKL